MSVTLRTVIATVVLLAALSSGAAGQGNPPAAPAQPAQGGQPAPPTPPARPDPSQGGPAALGVPLKLEVVLSRYQGEKRISSSPFELSIQAGGRCSLRMGVEVPVPLPGGSINYKTVGTNIDCSATRVDDTRFSINLTVEDSSIHAEEQRLNDTTPRASAPSFRTFRTMSAVVLRDRQTGQFTVATDKVTGEVIKADVTLTVVR